MKSQAQEIFEKVSYHLFSQGKRAMTTVGDTCLYRGRDGTKCAIGYLMPDSVYDADMEGCPVSGLSSFEEHVDRDLDFKNMLLNERSLLEALQAVHDYPAHWETSEKMTNELIDAGCQFKLSVTFLDGCYFGMENPYGK